MKTIASLVARTYNRLVNLQGEPRSVARGYALGVFLATTPLMGVHCILAVFIAGVLRWNRLAAGIGAFHSNLLTAPLLYGFTYFIGAKILKLNVNLDIPEKPFKLLSQGTNVLSSLTIGGLIIGIPLAILCYYLCYFILKRYQLFKTIKLNPNGNRS